MRLKLEGLVTIVVGILLAAPTGTLAKDTNLKEASRSSIIVLEPRVILRDSSAQRSIFSSPDNAEQELQIFLKDNLTNLLQGQFDTATPAVAVKLQEALHVDILDTLSSPAERVVRDGKTVTLFKRLKSKRNLSALEKIGSEIILFTAFNNQLTSNAAWFRRTVDPKELATKQDAVFVACLIHTPSGKIIWGDRGLVPFSKILANFRESEAISSDSLKSVLAFKYLIK